MAHPTEKSAKMPMAIRGVVVARIVIVFQAPGDPFPGKGIAMLGLKNTSPPK
jgi:hypothetical protein